MAAIRVLLADDHNLFRQGLREICEARGELQVVGEAADGEEAVRLAKNLHPDVCLIDVGMPRLNGLQATTQIVDADPAARVIVLSMYCQDDIIFAALKAGARGYLGKDVNAQDLLEGIRRVCRGEALISPSITARILGEFQRMGRASEHETNARSLTPGEMDVLRLVAQGKDNLEIARKLNLSEQTVANRLRVIYQKIQVENRTQAALYAIRRGWVDLGIWAPQS